MHQFLGPESLPDGLTTVSEEALKKTHLPAKRNAIEKALHLIQAKLVDTQAAYRNPVNKTMWTLYNFLAHQAANWESHTLRFPDL